MPQTPQSPEPEKLDFIKQDTITVANRAPNSKDKGFLWIKQTDANDATMTLYIRHTKSGAWCAQTFTKI